MADLSPVSGRLPRRIAFTDLAAQQAVIRADIDRAMARVLDAGSYILGEDVGVLERRLAAFSGAGHCISCANGTDALQLVLMAEDIGPGDAVLVPAFTFVSTAEAVMERLATPVIADVNPATFNMDAGSLVRAIDAARRAGLRPRAVIAVDLFGLPADYGAIGEIAAKEGLVLIADAAQSFGATLEGCPVGRFGKYTTTSFFPAKPLGCYGDGGAIFTEDPEAASLLRSLRFHGRGADKYDNVRVGLNSRLDTLQAAILLEKLMVFPGEIEARNAVAARYGKALAGAVRVPVTDSRSRSVWAQYTIVLDSGADRDALRENLDCAHIPTAVYYPKPLHRQGVYADSPCDPNGLQNSEILSKRVLSLPMHAYLDEDTQNYICTQLLTLLG